MCSFPNNFWGWGGEDDVVSDRLRDNRVEVDRPGRELVGKVTDLEEVLQKELREWGTHGGGGGHGTSSGMRIELQRL